MKTRLHRSLASLLVVLMGGAVFAQSAFTLTEKQGRFGLRAPDGHRGV
jgi:hypothetical protein